MKAWRDVLFVLVTRNSREHMIILKNDIALITIWTSLGSSYRSRVSDEKYFMLQTENL